MDFRSIFAGVICDTFERECGKWQSRSAEPTAFQVSFAARVDPDEEGYRYRDLVLYAPMTYVRVVTRERWDVVPVADLRRRDDGEILGLLPGKAYSAGSSAWVEFAYHDSCWRQGVEGVLVQYERDVIALDVEVAASHKFWRLVLASRLSLD